MKVLLVPYKDTLAELKFEIVWYANLPHLTRELYERVITEDKEDVRLWAFLESTEGNVSWTVGTASTGAWDLVASSSAKRDSLKAFNETLRQLCKDKT